MWWSVPESESHARPENVRSLALAGSIQRRQRTVLTLVPISSVAPNPDQPRKHFAEEALAELAASIKIRGLLQPVVLRRSQSGYQLLAGERRLRAAQIAGLDRIPALVREGEDALELALIENLQREDLTPLEEAEALAVLIERHGYSHRAVAELLGKSRPYVSNTLALNRLPEAIKAHFHRNGQTVSRELLLAIARERTPEAAEELWKRVQSDTVSVRVFRAEKAHAGIPPARDICLAARRLNRALRRASRKNEPFPVEHIRILRTTQRLIDRALIARDSAAVDKFPV
jgi:ParB family chromosome partitioning protein